MPGITGQCRCGQVKYAASAEPIFIGICHCSNCQKSTGSAFGAVLAIPTAGLTVEGATTVFTDTGDTGQPIHRSFCPVCGSTMTQTADVMAGVTMLPIGTLNDPSWATPAMQIYCDSAMPWAVLPGLRAFPGMPAPN